jgi:hypothetical protein
MVRKQRLLMHFSSNFTPVQRSAALAIPIIVAAWFLAVPAVLSTSTFIAFVGVVMGLGWVASTTYWNAQPASSLAQSIHDSEQTGAPARRKTRRP